VNSNLQVVTNAIMLSAYCIGNSAGPFMWKSQYKPRYVVFPLTLGVL
jgi:hypothetical protein